MSARLRTLKIHIKLMKYSFHSHVTIWHFLSKGTKTDFEAVFKNFSPGILQEFNSTSFDPAHKTANENF